MQESINQLVDGLVVDMVNDEGIENGRIKGWFKKAKNWFKRTVNVVATVVTRAVIRGAQGAVAGFMVGGVAGLAWGAGAGAILGAVEGLDCYSSNHCVTCVFCQPDPNKPCPTRPGC